VIAKAVDTTRPEIIRDATAEVVIIFEVAPSGRFLNIMRTDYQIESQERRSDCEKIHTFNQVE
jgi:hypothetical protein